MHQGADRYHNSSIVGGEKGYMRTGAGVVWSGEGRGGINLKVASQPENDKDEEWGELATTSSLLTSLLFPHTTILTTHFLTLRINHLRPRTYKPSRSLTHSLALTHSPTCLATYLPAANATGAIRTTIKHASRPPKKQHLNPARCPNLPSSSVQ